MARTCWAHAMGNCSKGPLTREHIVPVAAFEGASRREREALPVTTVLTDATAAQTVRHLTLKISRPTHYARLTMKSYRRWQTL